VGSRIRAGPAASDQANFFSLTITVKAPEPCDAGGWIDGITDAIKKGVSKISEEFVLVQSVAGGFLTLRGAMKFAKTRNRKNLQYHLRTRHVEKHLPPGIGVGNLTCIVSTLVEDERHVVYESLRRMAAAAGPGAGGQQPGPPATRTLVVVDSVLAAPGRSAAVAAVAPRDSAEVGPLCGQNRSAFIRVVVRVDACHSSIVESAGLEAGASSHADPYLADPYLASGVVDAAGQFLEQRQMDFILSTNVNGPRRGWMELVCLASAPGFVDTHQTARDLRRAIEESFVGGPWKGAAIIRHLEVTTSTEAEFQTARAALAGQVREDSAFHLVVECGVATRAVLNSRLSRAPAESRRVARPSADKRRRTDSDGRAQAGEVNESADPALPGAAAVSPEQLQPPSQPPPAAASFAAVTLAGQLQNAFSDVAAAASTKHGELKASFQPPLGSEEVLAMAKASLVLLEGVMPILLRLARFADDVSRWAMASAPDVGLRAGIQEALLTLCRADDTAPPSGGHR
jgi:hypothetical protein